MWTVALTDTQERALALVRIGHGGKVAVEQALKLADGTVRKWFKEDAAFREAWHEALEDASEEVEAALRTRALAGDTNAMQAYLKVRGGKDWAPVAKSGDTNVLVLASGEEVAALAARLRGRELPPVSSVVPVRSVEAGSQQAAQDGP